MGNKIVWIILFIVTSVLVIFFLLQSKVQLAGDIPEYFGITESILSHVSVTLSPQDQVHLEKVLNPGYFVDPGYYLVGVDGNRYPVHFILYSLLALPIRLLLFLFHANELKTLALTNVAIFFVAVFSIYRGFSLSAFQKGMMLLLLLVSPLAFFFAWPGPDLYYVMLLLVALFFFYKKSYLWAACLVSLASWHSQPLLVVSIGFSVMYLFSVYQMHKFHRMMVYFNGLIPLALLVIPYAYNYLAFGVLTPWTLLQNGWTQIYGFGLQNASLQRLFEMMFDLNMGLLWYAPLLVLGGIFYWIKSSIKDKRGVILVCLVIITAFFYQTNPAWHFGTAGFGPSRHVIYLLPFLIYFLSFYARASLRYIVLIGAILISQMFILSLNNGFLPNWENTLYQSPMAKFVLNRYPSLYNPTPEIFVDRTNHTDMSYISTAIYRDSQTGNCKKAYVLLTERQKIEQECGFIPARYEEKFDNPFLRKASYARNVWTIEAIFFPDATSCDDSFDQHGMSNFICMKTLADVIKLTKVNDPERFTQVGKGVWKMQMGNPVKVTVPAGYQLQYYSFDGFYINYD